MRMHTHLKSKGASRPNPHHAAYELKHRVVMALNKLIDRDTCRIGAGELDMIVRGLSPEEISPFLSCISDQEPELKTAVRKECIRLMGLLVTVHETLARPHLGKMVSSIVKRLKDSNSVVRDVCVQTVGVFASKIGNQQSECNGSSVALVKPFFEALCEQNKQVQSGAALCLASAIDNMEVPPASVLQQMLARTTKMLKSRHFMAKPALVELIRSFIQAGCAPSASSLSTAVGSIREALQSSDWMTRKASAVALEQIGTNGVSFLAHCKAPCVSSLESCRFDKVKPVRDAVLQALHCWRTVPDLDMPEASDTGSFTKENLCGGEFSDLAGVGSSGSIWEVNVHRKQGPSLVKKKGPFIGRANKITSTKSNGSKLNDWRAELAVSKISTLISDDSAFEESEGSFATKTLDIVASNVRNSYAAQYGYPLVDDKKEDSHASNQLLDNDANFVTVPRFSSYRDDEISHLSQSRQFTVERHEHEEKLYSSKIQGRKSLASTITNSDDSEAPHVHCLQTEKEIIHIRKQLLEIGKRQSCLTDLLQVFTAKTMDSLSNLQLKVSGLEQAVDSMAHGLRRGMSGDLTQLRDMKSLKTPSHGLSMSNSRSSLSTYDKHSSVVPPRSSIICKEKILADRRDVIHTGRASTCNTGRFLRRKEAGQRSSLEKQSLGCGQNRKRYEISPSASDHSIRSGGPTSRADVWEDINYFLDGGDLDSAYKAALSSRDGLLLIELLDRTGPVLEFLSNKTINDLFITLSSYLSDQGFMNTIVPWLQQMLELSAVHGSNYIPLSSKAKCEILAAVHETLHAESSHPAGKCRLKKFAVELQELWGQMLSAVA